MSPSPVAGENPVVSATPKPAAASSSAAARAPGTSLTPSGARRRRSGPRRRRWPPRPARRRARGRLDLGLAHGLDDVALGRLGVVPDDPEPVDRAAERLEDEAVVRDRRPRHVEADQLDVGHAATPWRIRTVRRDVARQCARRVRAWRPLEGVARTRPERRPRHRTFASQTPAGLPCAAPPRTATRCHARPLPSDPRAADHFGHRKGSHAPRLGLSRPRLHRDQPAYARAGGGAGGRGRQPRLRAASRQRHLCRRGHAGKLRAAEWPAPDLDQWRLWQAHGADLRVLPPGLQGPGMGRGQAGRSGRGGESPGGRSGHRPCRCRAL